MLTTRGVNASQGVHHRRQRCGIHVSSQDGHRTPKAQGLAQRFTVSLGFKEGLGTPKNSTVTIVSSKGFQEKSWILVTQLMTCLKILKVRFG